MDTGLIYPDSETGIIYRPVFLATGQNRHSAGKSEAVVDIARTNHRLFLTMPPQETSLHANATNDAHAPLALEPALEVPGSAISGGLQLPSASAAGAGAATT